MELLAVRHLNFPSYLMNRYSSSYPRLIQIRRFSFVLPSKKSDFQDFQGYAKPSRLLPASEVQVCTDALLEKLVRSVDNGESESLYKVTIRSSSFNGSGLSDMNAGVLLCLVDENGDSVLQRISASSNISHSMQLEDRVSSEVTHFQRGSVDEFTFKGPKLAKLRALWISLESGQWRLASISLICQSLSPSKNSNDHLYSILRYEFMADDVLLGEGTDISMLELRPSLVTEVSSNKFVQTLSQSTSLSDTSLSNDESMKEYVDLKFSLLLYDFLLILAGSTTVSFLAGENSSFAFLIGGIGGFLYLFLLQRSVDGLPSPALNESRDLNKFFGGFKGQVTTFVLAFALASIELKLGSEDHALALTPKDLIFGMLGFLACKVAVVLAAFKPLPIGVKENGS